MPFPANWLEELVIEWLDLDGFAISTSVFVPAKGGGRLSPDVVGARLEQDGILRIRHCEAAMSLIDAPEKVAGRYLRKFSPEVVAKVRQHFGDVFPATRPGQDAYEKWVITFRPGQNVRNALAEIPEIRICELDDFVVNMVLPAIARFREPPNTKTTQVPSGMWLLHLIDQFHHFGLIAGEKSVARK